MKIIFRVVPDPKRKFREDSEIREDDWPEDWPVPRLGERVTIENGESLEVTHVEWFPYGDSGGTPFVYVVLH